MRGHIDEIDALYERDPGDFVAARNELVRELKKAGDKERAAEVAKLRRPNAAAWAVNQLTRRHRGELDDLLRAGEQLRAAQDDALAGGDPDTLRHAARARREAVARLADRAAAILAEHGSDPDAHRNAITSTLDAASLDAERAEEVVRGRLTSELSAPSGFRELDLADHVVEATQAGLAHSSSGGRGEDRAAQRKARQEAKERQAEAEKAASRAEAARRRLERAEAEVERAESTLRAARRRAREVAEEVAEAERDAEEARRQAERAAAAASS